MVKKGTEVRKIMICEGVNVTSDVHAEVIHIEGLGQRILGGVVSHLGSPKQASLIYARPPKKLCGCDHSAADR